VVLVLLNLDLKKINLYTGRGGWSMNKKFFFIILSCVLPLLVWANGNKEYVVTDLQKVDDFEDADTNPAYKEKWTPYDDKKDKGTSKIVVKFNQTPGYDNSKNCMYMNWTLDDLIKIPYAGITKILSTDTKGFNLTGYYGIRFYAKGAGYFSVRLGIPGTRKVYNYHRTTDIALYPDWQLYEIPFSRFQIAWGPIVKWDPSNVICAEWGMDSQQHQQHHGEMYIDNISFYKVKEVEKKIPEADRKTADNKTVAQPEYAVKNTGKEQFADKRVAVVGIESQEIDRKVSHAMVDFIINAFVNDGSLKVVDRQSIEKILDEQSFQSKDFADTSKMIKVGKLAGAEYISIGSLSKVGGTYYLNIKLISVESAEIIGSSIATAKDDAGFFMMTNEGVSKLFNK
jgi:TolB-like protein